MTYCRYVPIRRFLPWLASGWRFSCDIAEPMMGNHGHYACLMVRGASQ